jgi:hypothetical protein
MRDSDVAQLRLDAVQAARAGWLLVGVSCLFLTAVGWWGAGQRWGHALAAGVVAWVLAWAAGVEREHGRVLAGQADVLEALDGSPCCCGMDVVPAGAHFTADRARVHTVERCQDLHVWAASGGEL